MAPRPAHASTPSWQCPPHTRPRAPRGPSPHPEAHRRHWCPLLRLPPLTSHNLAQIFVYVCVSVCPLCWWLTKSPPESKLRVSPRPGRAGLGLLAEPCWLVDQAPLCLSPPPHPAPSSRPSPLAPSPVTTTGSTPSLLLLQPSLLSSTWGGEVHIPSPRGTKLEVPGAGADDGAERGAEAFQHPRGTARAAGGGGELPRSRGPPR